MTPEQQEGINNFAHALGNDPDNWDLRTQLAKLQFNSQQYDEAAATIWTAPEIPSTAASIALASRILSKAHPRKSLKLLTMALESTRHKPANLMALAEELMAQGMVLAATRFYGAATSSDMTLADPDFEAWLLWTDHHQKLWGDFTAAEIQLGDAPWLGISDTRENEVIAAANEQIDGVIIDELSTIKEDPALTTGGSTPGAPPPFSAPETQPTSPSVDSAPVPTREEAWGGGTIAPPAAAVPPPPATIPPPSTPQVPSAPAASIPTPPTPQPLSPPPSQAPPTTGVVPPPPAASPPPGVAPMSPPPSSSDAAPTTPAGGPKKLKLAFPTESETLRPSQRVSENVDE